MIGPPAVNSAQAMPEVGILTIRTENVSLDEQSCKQHAEAIPGDYVLLTISDTGCGIETELLEKIFEPFFTTKDVGVGTGLGLSIIYGIMMSHKGFIKCESRLGVGTTFSLYFPRFDTVVEEVAMQEGCANLTGHETILLVDDEDELVTLASEAFAGYGYTLITAGTGEDAVRLYQEHGHKIDLVVLDLVMPGLGGTQ